MGNKAEIHIYLSNKAAYSLIAFLVVLILGVGVYAIPDPGHGSDDIESLDVAKVTFPTCGEGNLWGYSGGVWDCITPTSFSGDNLGNHIATQNIKLNNKWLSNDGGNEGIKIANDGALTIKSGFGTWTVSSKEYSGGKDLTISDGTSDLVQLVGDRNTRYFNVNGILTGDSVWSGSNMFANGNIYSNDYLGAANYIRVGSYVKMGNTGAACNSGMVGSLKYEGGWLKLCTNVGGYGWKNIDMQY